MTLSARTLQVTDYRNFSHATLELSSGVTILVGRNAAGKTNLIEALQLLTSGRSFRRPTPAELVRTGHSSARMELVVEGDGRHIDLACEVVAGKRQFVRNGKRCRASGVRGVLPSVLFCPDDLDMVKRSARLRREALDTFGIQLNEQYAQLVSSYERIVEQRNTLLRTYGGDPGVLAAWDEALVQTGVSLMMHRTALLARVRAHLIEAYRGIAEHEELDVRYVPSISDEEVPVGMEGAVPFDRATVTDLFWQRLGAARDDELRRGMTLVGPHRDEIRFTIDGRDARTFASQGQQRSLVLAWKVAEVQVTRDILGAPPLLLLDDVMSELDAARRHAFLAFIQEEIQTVITTTNLGYFSDDVLRRARVVTVGTDGLGAAGAEAAADQGGQ